MMSRIITIAAVAWASTCLLMAHADEASTLKPLDLSAYTLSDYHGRPFKLADLAAGKPLVIAILGSECPLAKLYAPRLSQLADEYRARGVEFVGLDANFHDTPSKIAAFAQAHKLTFPVLLDT